MRRWMTTTFQYLRDDRGAASVEMAGLVFPAVVLGVSLIVGVWVVSVASFDVHAAAGVAARAASLQASPDAAADAAQEAAATNLAANRRSCATLTVTTDTTNFVRGGSVAVTVRCGVDLGGLGLRVLHGAAYTSTAHAPIDLYGQVPS
jgi:Flp pilus assembly protein TadG